MRSIRYTTLSRHGSVIIDDKEEEEERDDQIDSTIVVDDQKRETEEERWEEGESISGEKEREGGGAEIRENTSYRKITTEYRWLDYNYLKYIILLSHTLEYSHLTLNEFILLQRERRRGGQESRW